MSFLSIKFVSFVFFSTIIYYLLPKKWQKYLLLIINFIFYFYLNHYLTFFLIASIISVYYGAILIKKYPDKKRLIFILTILLNLGFLFYFKYSNIYLGIFNFLFNKEITFANLILPMGISYYTLMALSYLIDTYNEKYLPDNNIINVSLYLSFFPLLIEGPIARYNDLSPQLTIEHKFNYNQYKDALVLIMWGYIKKLVIADRCGIYVGNVFNHGYTGTVLTIGIILYTIQIYTDFSGCMDIVMGISELFGIKVKPNFKQPFFSKTIEEFWTRWHITLGSWLKDYIFYPISINKKNLHLGLKLRKKHPKLSRFVTMAIPLFFVWFLMGLWHGPTLKYIIYGMYYYVLMLLGLIFNPYEKKLMNYIHLNTEAFSFKLWQMFRTTLLVMFGMLIFKVDNIKTALEIVSSTVKANVIAITNLGLAKEDFRVIIVMTILLLIVSLCKENKIDLRQKSNEQNVPFQWICYIILIMIVIIYGIYGYGYDPSSFIYGGF